MRTLVIGDVHGHFDRLEALLSQEGVIGECPDCEGTGDGALEGGFCETCDGDGIARIAHNVKVIQLGDLGHFGSNRDAFGHPVPGSPTGDLLCWDAAINKGWIDVVLWGNHDRALISDLHTFGGYIKPSMETFHIVQIGVAEGKVKLAEEANDFLLTHAGVHKAFSRQKNVPEETKYDPRIMADWLNKMDAIKGWNDSDEYFSFRGIRDAVGKRRYGDAQYGGIIWRDAREKLFGGYRQIFGHSRGDKVRKYGTVLGWSYCVDIGHQHNGRLAAMWLPNEEVVEVNTNVRQP